MVDECTDDGTVLPSIESFALQSKLPKVHFLFYEHIYKAVIGKGNWKQLIADKICMMTTRLACNQAIESSYWRMDNNSDVGLLMGYVLYRLLIELGSMDLDTFSH
jgi:hypothetical protein